MSNPSSLFERLGGSNGIRALVDDIVARHMDNPTIQARFRPYLETPQRIDTIKRHTCDFLEAGSGGTAQYGGRSMPDAHRGMNISEAEFVAALDDILAALRARGVDASAQNDVLAIAYSLKGEIVHL